MPSTALCQILCLARRRQVEKGEGSVCCSITRSVSIDQAIPFVRRSRESRRCVVLSASSEGMAEREGACMYYGDQALARAVELLEEVGLPGGLLPLENVVESGHVIDTGYVWIKQKKDVSHTFKKAGKQVHYGVEIRGYLRKNRLSELTGVKAKELFLWVPIEDISIDASRLGKIFFKSIGGLGKLFPVEAFAKGE